MKKILSDLITLLEVKGIKTSSHDVADMLWLGAIMDQHNHNVVSENENKEEEKQDTKSENRDTNTKTEDNNSNLNDSKDEEKQTGTPDTKSSNPLYLDEKQGESSKKGEYHKVPTPRQYTQYNQFANVLKILRQQSLSNTEKVLDEDSTVEYIANTHIWDVITKPKHEKKFTLNIIIEKSESMEVWEEMTKDFSSSVASFFFFKELNIYYLKESEKEFLLYRDKKCESKVSVNIFHSLEERYLTMLMSDCISDAWGDVRGYSFLQNITKVTPFMILNMLPQRIWKRTILDDTWRIKFTHKEGWLNKYLISDIDEVECDVEEHIKVPMTTFDTISLKHWSNLIAGEKENWLYGSLFESKWFTSTPRVKDENQEDEDPVELVKDFEIFASPMAQKLAIYFSTVPLSMDIMKIVQKVSLPESNHTHLAEVFLSGLLKKTSLRTPSDKIIYEFVNGVRDVLKDKLYLHKKIDILKENTSFIAKDLGSTIDFIALMENPNLEDGIPLSDNDRVFAEIMVDVFGKMGGEYTDKADTIKIQIKSDTQKIITSLKGSIGEPVYTQDTFFQREDIVTKIWDRLNYGENVILTAPRRFGKTSILKYIERNPKDDYLVSYLNVEAITNEDEFFMKIYEELINLIRSTEISSIIPPLERYNGSMFSDVQTISKNMLLKNKKIVFLIDELAKVIQNLNSQETKRFLENLHSLRKDSTNIQFVFADATYAFNKYPKITNDLSSIAIPPLREEEAINFIDSLFRYQGKRLNQFMKQYILDEIGLLIPFYIQVFMKKFMEIDNYQNLNTDSVDNIIDNLIKEDVFLFASWKYRLKELMTNYEETDAISILNYLSLRDKYSYPTDIGLISDYHKLKDILNILEKEYYLFSYYNDYMMDFNLLRRWWKKNIDNPEQYINSLIAMDLKNRGWSSNNIQKEYAIDDQKFVDIVLFHENRRVAIIEIKYDIQDINTLLNQMISYAKKLDVEFTYVTDGDRIYQLNIDTKIFKLINQFPSPADLNKKRKDIEIEEVDFEAMLEESFKKSESRSDLVTGTIVKIDEKDNLVVVDIGGGRDANLSLDEINDEEGNATFKVGDEIEVLNQGRGRISYKAAQARAALNEFISEYDEEQEYIIEGVVTKKNKGGYVIEVDGLEFFMPRTLSYLSSKIDPIGKKVKAVIVKVDKEKGSVIISRKELIERDKAKTEEIVGALLESKEPIVGTIKKITSYGMFVDVGGMDGLVHYSQISHKGPVNPSKYFEEGDEVNVVALEYDKKKRHLSLSIKDANPDPWADIDTIIGVGDTITATVSNIEPYGVFVDLGEDLEAFLHVSEISWDKNVKHPKDYLENNQEVNVEVIEIDKEKRRLRVSLKNLLPKPMDLFTAQNNVGDVVNGTVTSITDFGAFVRVGAVEGLLHNQEISWDKSKNAKSELNVGDEVEVKIIKIDRDAGKISLSKKALEASPIKAYCEAHGMRTIVTGIVKDKKDFGVFISLEDNVDALIRIEDLPPLKLEEIKKGQKIKGVITFMDVDNDRIRVSVDMLRVLELENHYRKYPLDDIPYATKEEIDRSFARKKMLDNNLIIQKYDITFQCLECNTKYFINCKELHWKQVDGSERGMDAEVEYEAEYFETCTKCNNKMSITFSCWEYPVGAEDARDIQAKGAQIISGDCCPDFHNDYGEEPTEDDEYSNLKRDAEIQQIEEEELRKLSLEASIENKKVLEIEEWLLKRYKNPNAFPITLGNFELYALEDILFEYFEDEKKDIINEAIVYIKEKYGDIKWELKEQILFDKVNQRINKMEELLSELMPYSELEFEYELEDFSDEDDYPGNRYLISKDFDRNYLHNIIDEMEEDINELKYIVAEKDFTNKKHIESLVEKKYRTTYGHINEPLGIDFDCKVYEEYTEEYDNCIIYIEVSESVDLEEAWEIANTDADMIEEWFHENYEDPANSLPYISKEGGYIPIHGSLVTAEEAILSEFEEDILDGAIKEAIERIENEYGFMEWSPIPQNQEELDSALVNETSKDFDIHEEKTENIEQYTVCQILGTSYFIKIILSEKDKKKMSSGYVYIDIRDYGIDAYLRYPNKKSATSYDMERFQNILNNAEKKNWEIELNCNNVELQESLGETYLTSEIFKPFNTEKEKEDYLNFLAIESEMEAWLSENYIEMEDELTYDAYEGKYKHIRGGTSDLEEILYSKFENIYPQDYVDRAIKTINKVYGDKDFTRVIYSEEDDTVPDISYFTKKYSHKIDEIVKWVFENYEDPISLTSDVLKEILVVEFQEKYSNDFIEKIIESIKLEYGVENDINERDKGFLNVIKRNGTIETLDASKIEKYTMDVFKQGELEQKQKEWLANKNKNLDFLRGRKKKKK